MHICVKKDDIFIIYTFIVIAPHSEMQSFGVTTVREKTINAYTHTCSVCMCVCMHVDFILLQFLTYMFLHYVFCTTALPFLPKTS